MLTFSSRRAALRFSSARTTAGGKRLFSSHTSKSRRFATASVATVTTAAAGGYIWSANNHETSVSCAAPSRSSTLPLGGDVVSAGTPLKEVATGILFPQLCNGFYLVGCGVRVKYGFVKVYAVGTYVDYLAMNPLKTASKQQIEQALLDPKYPRTIRIVMNRALSVDTFTTAIVEALEPRMKGQDLDKLEEFKKLNPPIDLVKGAEVELTIRGDMLLYKNAAGGVGTIRSLAFTTAMCDVYYGSDPVSPTHKENVLNGIPKM